MKVRSRLAALAAMLAVAFAAVSQSHAAVVGFVGVTTANTGYPSAPVGTPITSHFVFTAAAAASTGITGGWVLLGAQLYAITGGTLTVDAAFDTVDIVASLAASTPGGFAGGSLFATIDNPANVISVSEATQANVFAVAGFLDLPPNTGWIFDPGAPGPAGGLLSGSAQGVPEPGSMLALAGLGACFAVRRLRRKKAEMAV